MGYEYREVQCPWCDHIFMWNKHGVERPVFQRYRLIETREALDTAKCPKCGMEIIVLDHVLTGIDLDDDSVEPINGIFDGYFYDLFTDKHSRSYWGD